MSTILGSRTRRRRYRGSRPGTRKAPAASAVNLLARLGLVVRGLVYIVIGAIAITMAFGVARHYADTTGAIEAIASKPFGYLLLWILVIGFLGLAIWRFVQAAVKRLRPTETGRLAALAYAVMYALLFFSTLMFVVHGRDPAGSDAKARDWTRTVLSHEGGRVLIAAVGVALIIGGIVLAVKGVTARFTKRLRMGSMSGRMQNAVVRLGQVGYLARGAVVVGIGVAALDAAATYKAARAEGVDGVLRSFASTSFGPWLLVIVALGLIAYGVLSFLEARWRRTRGGVPV